MRSKEKICEWKKDLAVFNCIKTLGLVSAAAKHIEQNTMLSSPRHLAVDGKEMLYHSPRQCRDICPVCIGGVPQALAGALQVEAPTRTTR